jgi:chorismate mutase / prephenate dehydratase
MGCTGVMGQELSQLNDLRREIDAIDDAMHDHLIRRAELSLAIAKVKQPDAGEADVPLANGMRPAREAAILRRLLGRHTGRLPPQVIARIWREIISASLRMQSKFELHVLANTDVFDMARSYFGSLAPVRTHAKPTMVTHACAENADAIGLLPLPEMEEPGATWWAQLAPAGQPGPHVIAKLPFVAESDDTPSAYAIGSIEQSPSGDDTTLLLLEIASGMSRAKLRAQLKEAGLDATLTATGRTSDKKVPDEALLAVRGFVAPEDERLKFFVELAGDSITRIAPIGGFANPVILAAGHKQ